MVQESKCFEREGSGRLKIENKTSSLEFLSVLFLRHSLFKMLFKIVFCPRDIASIFFFKMKNPANAYRKGYLI